MTERLILLTLFGLTVVAAWAASRWWLSLRVQRLQRVDAPPELDALGLAPTQPAILYFTTTTCGICRLQQAPALRQVTQRLSGRVSVHQLDAVAAESLARYYGVLSVPTTVVLDHQRRPLHVNHGLAPANQLMQQLAAIEWSSPALPGATISTGA